MAAIQRLDAHIGFVTGWTETGVRLAKTRDGGATWQRIAEPAPFVRPLRFIDENVGWAAGQRVVLRTVDGGASWQEVLSIPTDDVYSEPIQQLQAVDGQLAWVLTGAQPSSPGPFPTELRRTTDGGQTWTILMRGNIAAIRFASASRGWAAIADTSGAVTVRVTGDGGATWTGGFRTGSGWVSGLDAATTQTAWLLTMDTAYCTASSCSKYELFRTIDGGVSWSSLGNPMDFACSGGHLRGPLFASTGRGWLALNLGAGGVNVGPGGLLTTENGGRTWRCTNTPPNTGLVSAADPLHVWVTSERRGGDEGTTLFASDDGGRTWHPLDLSSLH